MHSLRSACTPGSACRRRAVHFASAALAALALAAPPAFGADLVVSAAASLTNAFKSLAESYEKAHPDTKVVLNFGASDVLMQQIVKGAPADVFASADQEAMNKAEAEKVVVPATRHDFAANQIVMIVPHDSKLNLGSLQDLTKPGVKRIAFGNPASVPVGRYTKAPWKLRACGMPSPPRACLPRTCARAWTTWRAARSRPALCSPPTRRSCPTR